MVLVDSLHPAPLLAFLDIVCARALGAKRCVRYPFRRLDGLRPAGAQMPRVRWVRATGTLQSVASSCMCLSRIENLLTVLYDRNNFRAVETRA